MIKLVLVGDLETYIELVRMTTKTLATNYMGESMPLFSSVYDLQEYLQLDFSDLYDSDGEPTFNDSDAYDIPHKQMERELSKRLNNLGLSFPFHVVICGEYGFDRSGDMSVAIFREIKEDTVHGLKSPGSVLK